MFGPARDRNVTRSPRDARIVTFGPHGGCRNPAPEHLPKTADSDPPLTEQFPVCGPSGVLRQAYDRPQRYVILGRPEDCHVRSRTRPQRYEIPTRRKDCHVRFPMEAVAIPRAGAPTEN